jgi:hypothetical protein
MTKFISTNQALIYNHRKHLYHIIGGQELSQTDWNSERRTARNFDPSHTVSAVCSLLSGFWCQLSAVCCLLSRTEETIVARFEVARI